MVLCGHSIGGLTALTASQENPEIKNVVTLDPWFGVLEKAIEERNFSMDPNHDQNLLIIHTERYFKENEVKFFTNQRKHLNNFFQNIAES